MESTTNLLKQAGLQDEREEQFQQLVAQDQEYNIEHSNFSQQQPSKFFQKNDFFERSPVLNAKMNKKIPIEGDFSLSQKGYQNDISEHNSLKRMDSNCGGSFYSPDKIVQQQKISWIQQQKLTNQKLNFKGQISQILEQKHQRTTLKALSSYKARCADEFSNFDAKVPTRSLKGMSPQLYQIVINGQQLNYKNIATALIHNYNLENQSSAAGKQIQSSIKRRVYDSLNVMISAQVLNKDGKYISKGKFIPNLSIYRNQNSPTNSGSKMDKGKQLQLQICIKQKSLQEKAIKLKLVKQFKSNLNSFFNIKKQQQKKLTKAQSLNQKRIYFPFLVIRAQSQDLCSISNGFTAQHRKAWQRENSSTCDQYPGQNAVFLTYKTSIQKLKVVGDIDFVGELRYVHLTELSNYSGGAIIEEEEQIYSSGDSDKNIENQGEGQVHVQKSSYLSHFERKKLRRRKNPFKKYSKTKSKICHSFNLKSIQK